MTHSAIDQWILHFKWNNGSEDDSASDDQLIIPLYVWSNDEICYLLKTTDFGVSFVLIFLSVVCDLVSL